MATPREIGRDLTRLTERIVGTIAIGTQEAWSAQSRVKTGRAAASVQYGFGNRSELDDGLVTPADDVGPDEHYTDFIPFLRALQNAHKAIARNYRLSMGRIVVSSRIYYGNIAYSRGGTTGVTRGAIAGFSQIAGAFFGGQGPQGTVRRAILVGIARASRLSC